MKNKSVFFISFLIFLLLSIGCEDSPIPKPHGYIRTDFPEKEYRDFAAYPFACQIPTYSHIEKDSSRGAEKYWSNWQFPKFNATVYLSYKKIETPKQLTQYTEDTRKLAFKHIIKAEDIPEIVWQNKEHRVFGILYDIKGEVASQIQFYLTDSTTHFVRGAFYFNCRPNRDSLAPALHFLREDINKMIETFRWKYEQ
ncbi:MAG: gliding motility lipoprotein GldD [Bacteroidia bacterium]|nr:MAG: gliding motility lipoprotein GldD [Bacteroidia bacterium]